jgi:protease-4
MDNDQSMQQGGEQHPSGSQQGPGGAGQGAEGGRAQPAAARNAGPPHHPAPPSNGGPRAPGRPPKRRLRNFCLTAIAMLLLLDLLLANMAFFGGLSEAAGMSTAFEKRTLEQGSSDQVVALYSVSGVIDGNAAGRFRRFCNDVIGDANVKAVVLRVNSPGGQVSSADEMHEMVTSLSGAGKKVVVSMGGLAASGGYYISAPADLIYAEPTTITGSIGVLATWPVIGGTLEKIGVEMIVMKSHDAAAWKDAESIFTPPKGYQREHIQHVLDTMQQRFNKVVKDGRGNRLKVSEKSFSYIEAGPAAKEVEVSETEPFNGKIYLADEAMKLGLVDRIGYRGEAIAAAADQASLSDPTVKEYKPRTNLISELLKARSAPVVDLGIGGKDDFQTPRILLMWKAD